MTKKLFIFLNLSVAAVFLLNCAGNDYVTAQEAFDQGEYEISRNKLLNFVEFSDDEVKNATAYLQIGWSYFLEESYPEARSNLLVVLSNYGESKDAPYASVLLAHTYLREREDVQAKQQLQATYSDYRTSVWAEYALYKLARFDFDEYSFPKAVGKYKTLVTRYPQSDYAAMAYYDMGTAWYKMRQYARAESNYLYCIRNFSNTEAASMSGYRVSLYYEARGKIDLAYKFLDRVIEELPESDMTPDAYTKKGNMLVERKAYDEALAVYDAFIKRFPDHVDTATAWYQKGYIQYKRKNIEDAVSSYKYFLDGGRKSAYRVMALNDLLTIYLEEGQEESALEVGTVLIRDYSNDPAVALVAKSLMDLYYDQKEYQKGAEVCDLLLQSGNLDPDTQRLVSEYYILHADTYLGDMPEAIKAYKYYFETEPEMSLEHISYVRSFLKILKEHGSKEDRIKANEMLMNNSFSDYSDIARSAFSLANLSENQSHEKKEELYEKAAELDPASENAVKALYEVFKIRLEDDDGRKAQLSLKKMMRSYPESPLCAEALLKLYRYYKEKGDVDEASDVRKTLLSKYPDSSEATELKK